MELMRNGYAVLIITTAIEFFAFANLTQEYYHRIYLFSVGSFW